MVLDLQSLVDGRGLAPLLEELADAGLVPSRGRHLLGWALLRYRGGKHVKRGQFVGNAVQQSGFPEALLVLQERVPAHAQRAGRLSGGGA